MARPNRRISYIKRPMAKRSYFSILCAVVALLSFGLSLYLSIRSQGNGGLNIAAWGLTSIIFSLTALGYGITAFLEKEMNYLLAKISIAMGTVLMVFWIALIVLGVLAG